RASHIVRHKQLIAELLRDRSHWDRALSTSSPFVDTWYADKLDGGTVTRYLRVSAGYIILSSLYVSVASEPDFFRLPAVKELIEQIQLPFERYVMGERNRAEAYYLFFLSVCLHPSLYFALPSAKDQATMDALNAARANSEEVHLVILVHGINT